MLAKTPGFTAVAVFSLALGIGANTSMFSVVNALFLQSFPVEDPGSLVSLYTLDNKNAGFLPSSYLNYKEYRDRNQVFSGLLLYSGIPLSLGDGGEPEQIVGQMVSGNYFDVLGVKPVLGRTFAPEEDSMPGSHPVAVISHGLWMRKFGGDAAVLGRSLRLNGSLFRIIGVAPKDFYGANALVSAEIWVPMMMYEQVFPRAEHIQHRRALLFSSIGRLRPGVGREQAEAAMRVMAGRLEREYPEDNSGRTITLVPTSQALINPNVRKDLLRTGVLLMSIVGMVLLIACANVANLLMVRATARTKEVALRLALGAGRGRLIRQFLTEGALLSLLGGVGGLLLAWWGRQVLWAMRPPILLARGLKPLIDARVLTFTLLLSLFTGLVFGVAPALRAARTDLIAELKERGAGLATRSRLHPRNVLVVCQISLSLIALVAAGLFLGSLRNAQRIDPGFETRHLLVLSYDLRAAGYTEARGREFHRLLLERVRSLPRVRDAALGADGPFAAGLARTVFVEGREAESDGRGFLALYNNVDEHYFDAVRIPIVKGRGFTALDGERAPRVAIINQAMANRFWPGQNAVGKRLRFFGDDLRVEVVGIARDANYVSLGEEPRAAVYVPLAQNYSAAVTLHVRTAGDPAAMAAAARREIRSVDPKLLLTDIRTIGEVIDEALWAPRTGAILLGAFGALALLLASIGIYGVVSYSVGRRAREMGIRMALGARPANVLRVVLGDGAILIGSGVVFGSLFSLALNRFFAGLLFGVNTADPAIYAAVCAVLALVALAACYLPARRATKVDPAVALRYE